jgi:hypothetical protein
MANRLKKLRSKAAERPDNAVLLNALPSAAIEPAAILEALRMSRAEHAWGRPLQPIAQTRRAGIDSMYIQR